jgi:cytoskeletal protein RodZ
MVAAQFRQAREAQRLTVHQVAEATKIRSDHIEALEEGNYNVFSAQIYIRGFVRNYARLLRLNEAQILAALDTELSQSEKFSAPPPLSARPHTLVDTLTLWLSKINWKFSLVALGAMLVLGLVAGIYTTWRHYRTADPLAGLAPGVYQSSGNNGETIPLPAPATRKP